MGMLARTAWHVKHYFCALTVRSSDGIDAGCDVTCPMGTIRRAASATAITLRRHSETLPSRLKHRGDTGFMWVMTSIGTVMREVRERLGESQSGLSHRLRVPPSSISRREQGHQAPTAAAIEQFVEATGVSLVVGPSGWSAQSPTTNELPYYGRVPCGVPLLIEEAAPEQVDLANLTDGTWRDGQTFMVQADGESMEPAIGDGDWLVVQRLDQSQPRVWDIVVAVVEGETVVAQVRHHPDRWDRFTLGKLNERYSIDLDDGADVRLLGRVVGSLRWRPMRE